MRWIVIILFGAWALGGIYVIGRRYWDQWRGRRVCRQWLCPQCQLAFGDSAGISLWQRRKDVAMKSALFSGVVLHCARCAQDYWFTWTGHHLDPSMRRGFEVAAYRWTWNT